MLKLLGAAVQATPHGAMSMAAAANYGGRLVHALPEREAPPHITRIAYPQQSPYAQQGLLQNAAALREPAHAYMGGHNPHMRVQTGAYSQVGFKKPAPELVWVQSHRAAIKLP